ncbi:hypothetical protein VU07_02330 [Desulfobulbus sp. F4]|nr:hypothetical protein [Desulfobulbus sp. F3]MCW5200637.1 hypothetical protein [Desulfobulbus sp. F4]
MTKLPAFAALFAVFVLGGCTVCTDCEPEYLTNDSPPTTIYRYTSYPGSLTGTSDRAVRTMTGTWKQSSSSVPSIDFRNVSTPPPISTVGITSRWGQSSSIPNIDFRYIATQPRPPVIYPPIYRPTQVVTPWPNKAISNGYWNSYGGSYYGGGYSGPPFSTPPMQSLPYPAEGYYPFKRPAPGVFVPGDNSPYYYTASPSYYP